MLKVNIESKIFSHPEVGASSLENNLFYQHNLKILKKIKEKDIEIDVSHLTPFYDLIFPESVVLNIHFVSENQKEILCDVFDIDVQSALGIYATNSGDGFIAEEEYIDSFEIFIFCPNNEKYYQMVKDYAEQSYVFIEDALSFYLSTLTHEIHHALIFMESSGGLTPKQVDIAYESEDFDNSVGDCASGCNLPRIEHMFSYEYSGNLSPIEVNERIVEEEGCQAFKNLNFDIDHFITEIEDACDKSFYEYI